MVYSRHGRFRKKSRGSAAHCPIAESLKDLKVSNWVGSSGATGGIPGCKAKNESLNLAFCTPVHIKHQNRSKQVVNGCAYDGVKGFVTPVESTLQWFLATLVGAQGKVGSPNPAALPLCRGSGVTAPDIAPCSTVVACCLSMNDSGEKVHPKVPQGCHPSRGEMCPLSMKWGHIPRQMSGIHGHRRCLCEALCIAAQQAAAKAQ